MAGQAAGQQESRLAQAAATLDLTIKGATVYQREDLVRRLTAAKDMLGKPSVLVYVVGEFKQGKSSLINALLTAQVCPVDDDIATAVPTVVKYAAEPSATATYVNEQETRVEPIPYESAAGYAAEGDPRGAEARARGLHAVQIGIQRRLLADGLVLVDTPGVGGLGSVHSTVTVGALPQAHAVIFCSDASQELTAAEIKFLKTAQELCPTILFALTKTDLHVEWRRILQLDLQHLKNAGVRVEPIALSSHLRLHAARTVDQAMNTESGFPALVAKLSEVVADSETVTLRAVGNHVRSVVDQLEQTVRARQSALEHPERTLQLTRDLQDTRERLERLRARSARWQSLLFDGLADVSSDIDHDLRLRARGVLMDAENAIDEGDPAKNFEEFASWLRQRLAGETMENYAELIRATRDVAERVAEHFELEESAIVVPLRVEAPVAKVDSLSLDTGFATPSKKGSTGMAGIQKAYGGLMMFTMLTHIAMLAVPLPIGIAAAALMGRSGMKDDRKRQLEARRSKAKLAVRRYVDEFNIHVGKDSRDVIRRIQRELRDGYTERLDELLRSLSEASKEAERALESEQTEQQQLERVAADLRSLAMLRGQADELLAVRAAVPA
jgi:GTPase SAR1 family protein